MPQILKRKARALYAASAAVLDCGVLTAAFVRDLQRFGGRSAREDGPRR